MPMIVSYSVALVMLSIDRFAVAFCIVSDQFYSFIILICDFSSGLQPMIPVIITLRREQEYHMLLNTTSIMYKRKIYKITLSTAVW